MVNIKLHPSKRPVKLKSNRSKQGYVVNFSFTLFEPGPSHPAYIPTVFGDYRGIDCPEWHVGYSYQHYDYDKDEVELQRFITSEELFDISVGPYGTTEKEIVAEITGMGYEDVEFISIGILDNWEYTPPTKIV